MQIISNRKEAGYLLAQQLITQKYENPIVLGMPRGGVVVAYEIAQQLNASLDVVITRKIGAPSQTELAIGAIAPNDIIILNNELIKNFKISKSELQKLIHLEKIELERRTRLYRKNKPPLDIKNNTAILVDDGLATGLTALAAVQYIRALKPKKIILAIGACSSDSAKLLRNKVDEVICLLTPEYFRAVGEWYSDFRQTTDEEVINLLNIHAFRAPSPGK